MRPCRRRKAPLSLLANLLPIRGPHIGGSNVVVAKYNYSTNSNRPASQSSSLHPLPSHVRVKVCCIKSRQEAALAMRYGVSAIGLVAQMPSGPGVIPEDTIADIADWLPPGISSFLLTSSQDSEEIIAQHKRCRTNTIQIVDKLTKGAYLNLKRSLPGVKIVQVIHVTGPESVEEVSQLSQQPIDAFLLDSGRPNLAIKELGGTGRVHDWMVSKKIIEQSPIPVYLAGGLNPDNVLEAVARLRPFGVDVCSGLRTGAPGYDLDEQKLSAFVQRLGLVGLSRGGSSSLGD